MENDNHPKKRGVQIFSEVGSHTASLEASHFKAPGDHESVEIWRSRMQLKPHI